MKKLVSLILIIAMCLSFSACGKSEAMLAAEDAINAIGEVTLDSEDKIVAAEEAYNALTEDEKGKFKMHDQLVEARAAYDGLVDQKAVNNVIALIDKIGEVTLDSGDTIDAASSAYNALSSDLQSQVTNKSTLDDAKNTLANLRSVEKDRIIAEKSPLFDISTDRIEGITWYEPKSIPNYIDIRSYVIPYIGVKGNNAWICTRFNYTADSWIFWNKLTIMADGTKYSFDVSTSDITRDNDTEVWEYHDMPTAYNVGSSDGHIVMLKAIAESDETIVRFEGNEYYYDLTVTASDKKAISDVLTLYEALTW